MTRQTQAGRSEALAGIWRRILRKPSITPDDNFFALGGDPCAALILFSEIAKEWGRELSPLLIYQAPTVSSLAAILDCASLPRLEPLVLLKNGNSGPPIFLAHGLGGSVMEFFELLPHIHTESPVYAMNASGLDGIGTPFDRIEDMASCYLNLIKQVQTTEPYRLIGYSLGGLVSLEVARHLSKSGKNVELLAMLDSYPHLYRLPFLQIPSLLLQRTRHWASKVHLLPSDPVDQRTGATDDSLLPSWQHAQLRYKRATFTSSALAAAAKGVRRSAHTALRRYRPRRYDGKITFVQAENTTVFSRDARRVWQHLALELDVKTVPGDHVGMITEHAKNLGSVLTDCLGSTVPFDVRWRS